MTISIAEQISPQTCHVISNEGMPFISNNQQHQLSSSYLPRGCLYLRFSIIFPVSFTPDAL